jgi:hypothetical protein
LRPYTFIHLCLSGVLAWWAFVLSMPGSVFAASKSYDIFTALSPHEGLWAAAFAAFSVFGLVGAVSRNTNLKWWSALALGAMHFIVAAFLWGGNAINTGSGTYAIIAAQAYYLLRKLVNFRGDQ